MPEQEPLGQFDNSTLVVAEGGLSNRLKCLVSGMRIAEKTASRLLMHWPYNDHFECNFSDLFENQIEEIDRDAYQAFIKAREACKNCRVVKTWHLEILPDDGLPENFSRQLPDSTGPYIDLEYDRIPMPIRADFLKYIHKLRVAKSIAQRVDEFSVKMDRHTIGLQIRTWSREMDFKYSERRVFFDLELIYKMMDRVKNSTFYISSDSEEVLKQIHERYGEKILQCPKKAKVGGQSAVGEQDALVDMLLLSKCSELKVSYTSTFGEMAWWFGGCSPKVELLPFKTYTLKLIHLGWGWFGIYIFRKLYFRHINSRLIKLIKPISNRVDRLTELLGL